MKTLLCVAVFGLLLAAGLASAAEKEKLKVTVLVRIWLLSHICGWHAGTASLATPQLSVRPRSRTHTGSGQSELLRYATRTRAEAPIAGASIHGRQRRSAVAACSAAVVLAASSTPVCFAVLQKKADSCDVKAEKGDQVSVHYKVSSGRRRGQQ